MAAKKVRKKGRLEKFFSLNQHRRRLGAPKVSATNTQFAAMKTGLVETDKSGEVFGSHKNIQQHFDHLAGEFAGKPELLFYHAKLIVLIRRGVDVQQNYLAFKELWELEEAFLCEHLNLRWLVSACDTIADHDSDEMAKALAVAITLLVNTIKFSETDVFAADVDMRYQPEKLQSLSERRVALPQGLSAFKIGTDDTIRNMRWRIDQLASKHVTGRILRTCFLKLHEFPNTYSRLKAHHQRQKTSWWWD